MLLPLLAACGDKGPSKADFLAEADPICKRGNDIAAVLTTPSDLSMMKDFSAKLADNAAKTADELAKLDMPGGEDGTGAKDLVKAMRDGAAAARGIIPEVDGGNYPAIEAAVTKAVDGFKAADAKARAYGSAECGKGEAEASGKLAQTAGATVKKAYIAKADALCKVANDKVYDLDEPQSMAELKKFLDITVDLAVKLTADVKAIPQPTTDKAKLDEVFTAQDQVLAKAKEAQAAVASGNEDKTFALLDELDVMTTGSNAKADAYGFKDCGSDE